MDWKKILCPVDFSVASREAVHAAVELARKHGASITLFHSYEMPIYPIPEGTFVNAGTIDEVSSEIRDKLLLWKKDFLKNTEGVTVHVEYTMGSPPSEIVRLAAAEKFDLIVMGTHGRTGLKHVLLGSVTEQVVRTSPCPVLTIRSAPVAEHAHARRSALAHAAA